MIKRITEHPEDGSRSFDVELDGGCRVGVDVRPPGPRGGAWDMCLVVYARGAHSTIAAETAEDAYALASSKLRVPDLDWMRLKQELEGAGAFDSPK